MKKNRVVVNIGIMIVVLLLGLTSCQDSKDNNTDTFNEVKDAKKLEIHFLDVGAGDSMYIEFPNGEDVLIDGGTPKKGEVVAKYLKKLEKNMELDYVISSHPDYDHAGGLVEVLSDFKVKNFIYPKEAGYNQSKTSRRLISLTKRKNDCSVLDGKPGKVLEFGDATLTFIQGKKDYNNSNEDSTMVHLKYKDFDCLFTGDVEGEAQFTGKTINTDVMVVPHHGSKGSSSTKFIKKYDPEYIVISTDGKKYGHPNKETLDRYYNYDKNIEMYRTDKCGTIKLETDGLELEFSTKPVELKYKKASINKKNQESNWNNNNDDKDNKYVYITPTGTKYHYSKKCSGLRNAKSIEKVTIDSAKENEYDECKIEAH